MNNRKKLRQSLTVLSLTVLMLAAVTLAWFVNWASPFVDRLNFSSAALHVDVSITDEQGNTLPSEQGNAKLIAEHLKPGDTLIYNVSVVNRGTACKVYLGLSELQNYVRSPDGTTWAAFSLSPGGIHTEDQRLGNVIRVSVWEPTAGAIATSPAVPPTPPMDPLSFREVPGAALFVGDQREFFFPESFQLPGEATLTLQYRVQFVGAKPETGGNSTVTGAVPGNSYTEKKLEGKFAVSATLAK